MSSERIPPDSTGEGRSKSRRRSLQRFVSKLIRPATSKKDRASVGGLTNPVTRATQDASLGPVGTVPPIYPGNVVETIGDTNIESQPITTSTFAVEQQQQTPVLADPITSTFPATTADDTNIQDPERTKPQETTPSTQFVISSKPIAKGRVTYANLSYQDRARLIAEKHGVEMSEMTFPDRQPGQRVEKAIRVRVHKFCHKCDTAFGPDRTCSQCQHRYCKNCTRTPPKSEKKTKRPLKEKDLYAGLNKPSKRGGQDLVHKQIRQRVHRRCHECSTDFGSTKECKSCGHVLCRTCPREPNKKSKKVLDEGNLSESQVTKQRTYKKTQRRVSYVCSECQTTFTESQTCSKCGHERCNNCTRIPPRKTKSTGAERPVSSSTIERKDAPSEPVLALQRPTSQDIVQGTATAPLPPPQPSIIQPAPSQSSSTQPNPVDSSSESASIIDQLRKRFSLTKIT